MADSRFGRSNPHNDKPSNLDLEPHHVVERVPGKHSRYVFLDKDGNEKCSRLEVVRQDWKARVGDVSEKALRVTLVSIPHSGGWTIKGTVDIPSSPFNDAERHCIGSLLVRHAQRTAGRVFTGEFHMTRWDIVAGGKGVVVEQAGDIPTITDKDIIGEIKITTPPKPSEDQRDRLLKMLQKASEDSAREYPRNRYMRFETRAQLTKRHASISRNLMLVNHRGEQTVNASAIWARLTMDLENETQARGYPFSNMGNLAAEGGKGLPRHWNRDVVGRAADVLRGKQLPKGFVVKYGKREHMIAMYQHGRVRVGSARRFKDMCVDSIQDDELRFEHRGVEVDGKFMFLSEYNKMPTGTPCSRASLTLGGDDDFWLYCVSRVLRPELFSDFGEADACVMFGWQEFYPRVVQAVRGVAETESHHQVEVDYRDPLGAFDRDLSRKLMDPIPVWAVKHFGYTYQHEHRAVWVPAAATRKLAPLDVEVGSMQGYATLLVLD